MKRMIAMMTAIVALTTQAQTWYAAPGGSGDGSDWANAAALTDALWWADTSGGEILLAGGTYIHPGAAAFWIPDGVSMTGGYDPGTGLRTQVSTLDGNRKNIAVVSIGHVNQRGGVRLEGLVITGAYGSTPFGIEKWGNGNVTLVDCTITGNEATGQGRMGVGASFKGIGTIVLEGCEISDNLADGYTFRGIGIYSTADLVITNSLITRNRGSNPGNNYNGTRNSAGLGLYAEGGSLVMVGTEVSENVGGAQGHHMFPPGGAGVGIGGSTMSVFIENCLFRDNRVYHAPEPPASGGHGGALRVDFDNDGKTIDIINCTFAGNRTDANEGSGGAVYVGRGKANIRNCIFWGNLAMGNGGTVDGHDVYVAGSSLDLSYTSFSTDFAGNNKRILGIAAGIAAEIGEGVFFADPLFASEAPYDVRLMSEADGDFETSPCIDAGDPLTPTGSEPVENYRVNLGVYGTTAAASTSIASEKPLPKVLPEDNFLYTRYVLGGVLTNAALTSADVFYVCYGTLDKGPTTNGWDTVVSVPMPRKPGVPFTTETLLLAPLTQYHVRVYAANSHGGTWSEAADFTTGDDLPFGHGVGGGSTVVHVRQGAVGANDGSDWGSAFTTVAEGIAALSPSRPTLWIEGGTFALASALTFGGDFRIVGGFAGTETAEGQRALDVTGIATNYTVLSQGGGYCPVSISGGDLLMDAIVIADMVIPQGTGQAIAALNKSGSGTLTLFNCKVTNNVANTSIKQGVGCRFTGAGTVVLDRCEIADNLAGTTDSYTTDGIGIYSTVNLVITNSLIARNRGGNPANNHNSTRNSAGLGLSAKGGSLVMVGTEVVDNYGGACNNHQFPAGGAGVCIGGNVAGGVLIQNCLFRGNRIYATSVASTTDGHGGALRADFDSDGKAIDIVNCTFADNRTDALEGRGGALYVGRGKATIKNCIFWGNRVAGASGMIDGHDLFVAGTELGLSYTSFSTNAIGGGVNVMTIVSTVASDIGEGVFAADPLFVDATTGDFRLMSEADGDPETSPCIDAGDPLTPIGDEPVGNTRVNLGVYGGTANASKSIALERPLPKADAPALIAYTRYVLGGVLTNATLTSANVFYICYGTLDKGETTDGWDTVVPLSKPKKPGEPFTTETLLLAPLTTYHVRVYAENYHGGVWSDPVSFTTGDDLPFGHGIGGGPTVVHVRRGADGNNDGSDWGSAFTTVEEGVAALSASRPTLWIEGGTFAMTKGLTFRDGQRVFGGFAGTEEAEGERAFDTTGIATNYTVLSQGGGFLPVTVEDGDILMDTIVVSDMVIPLQMGQLIAALNKSGWGTLTLFNCKVTNNYSNCEVKQASGCRFTGTGTVVMARCEVTDNIGDNHTMRGIGIYSTANLVITDSLIARNRGVEGVNNYLSTRNSAGLGLYAEGGSLIMVNTDIVDNHGGACNQNNTPAGAAGVYIGGNIASGVLVKNCLFAGNRIYDASYTSALDGHGGAMRVYLNAEGKVVDLINCTFAGNQTDAPNGRGGALYVDRGTVNVRNCIFWDNAATGIDSEAGADDIYVADTLVLGPNTYPFLGTLALSYSCIETDGNVVVAPGAVANFGEGIFAADPRFVDAAGGNYRLSSKSPCIDAGDPTDDWSLEPEPNGRRINLGRYGGTSEAATGVPAGTLILVR